MGNATSPPVYLCHDIALLCLTSLFERVLFEGLVHLDPTLCPFSCPKPDRGPYLIEGGKACSSRDNSTSRGGTDLALNTHTCPWA